MEDNLIGYLLDALEPDEHREVEAQLRTDPEARRKVDLLRKGLEPLAADRDGMVPPRDLAIRTLALVSENCCKDLPHMPKSAPRTLAFPRFVVKRIDVLIAACLLILLTGIGVTWVNQARFTAELENCKLDLKKIHDGLVSYTEVNNGHLPNVEKMAKPPKNVAGLVLPFLISLGHLPKDFSLRCPGGKNQTLPFTFDQAVAMPDNEFVQKAANFTPCYGYTLGYRDGGVIKVPKIPHQENFQLVVIMADGPPSDPLLGNSPNHAGRGQNVLFIDGHVKFCTDRTQSFLGDDLYLSKNKKVEAGLDWQDNVIGQSRSRP